MTHSEENYLKIIYHLSSGSASAIPTNAIAHKMDTKASSVTDMLQKLFEKDLVKYTKYQGVSLTETGKKAAKMVIRKHRLWEVFLVEKLGFTWDEVHEIAEELEHIPSDKLTNKLDAFLNFPREDPHGDPIPDENGEILKIERLLLSEVQPPQQVMCLGVKDSSAPFLQYLDKQNIALGSILEVLEVESFDDSILIRLEQKEISISPKIGANLYVKLL